MTFNPASGTAHEDAQRNPGATCEDCGTGIAEHRDGGLAYGLICPWPNRLAGGANNGPTLSNEPKDGWRP